VRKLEGRGGTRNTRRGKRWRPREKAYRTKSLLHHCITGWQLGYSPSFGSLGEKKKEDSVSGILGIL
jgi:hypothetical protein